MTWEPLIPSAPLFLITMSVKLGEEVEDRLMPSPAELWIVPPEPAVVPLPVTVSPPEVPVLDRLIPGLAPLDEMLWKVSPPEPIVVLETLSAVPVVVVIVLPVPVAETVPPPVAENPVLVPVLMLSVPLKLIVAPVLPLSDDPGAVVGDVAAEGDGATGVAGDRHGVSRRSRSRWCWRS